MVGAQLLRCAAGHIGSRAGQGKAGQGGVKICADALFASGERGPGGEMLPLCAKKQGK